MTSITEQSGEGSLLLSLSVAVSTAAHIAVAGYFLLSAQSKPGAVETPTMAISINLETTEILNAAESPDAPAAAAPSDASPETAPPEEAEQQADTPVEDSAEKQKQEELDQQRLAEDAERKAREEAERQREEERNRAAAEAARAEEARKAAEAERQRQAAERAREKERQLAGQRKREEERERAEQRNRERKRAEERARERKAAEAREAKRVRRREARRKAEAEAERRKKRAQASSAARGTTGSKVSKGRVSASQGDLRNYGASVRARIARNASGNRGRGEVVLSFALSPSGRLVSVRIIRSSGNPSLDRSILAAVRRASPFPKPPDGTTRRQLHFTIPVAVR